MKRKARDAILQLIELEREGEQIDRTLLKNILGIFQEVGMGQMTCYQQDFEAQLLKSTAEYYKRKAAVWIEEDSCPDYMVGPYTTHCKKTTAMCHGCMLLVILPSVHVCCYELLALVTQHVAVRQPKEAMLGGYCISVASFSALLYLGLVSTVELGLVPQ